MIVSTPFPLIVRRLLADPRVAEASLGEGPARAQTGLAVRGFIEGMRCFELDARRTCASVEALPDERRRFAWEGVGLMAQSQALLPALLELAPAEAPLLLIGAGWASALVERALPSSRNLADNEHWWQLDGYGFCVGLLHRLGPARASMPLRPKLVTEVAVEIAIDQGLGRSLYFLYGGTAASITAEIDAQPLHRRAGLWFGVGLASVVTDGLDEHSRMLLRERGGQALRHGETLGELLLARRGMRPFTAPLRRLEQCFAELTAPPLELMRALTGA